MTGQSSAAPDGVVPPLRDGLYTEVRDAWTAGYGAHDPQHPPFRDALASLGRVATA